MPSTTRGGIGESVPRPDGPAKVRGEFSFGSDLVAPGMLFGKTLRSPHAHAVVRSIDSARASAMPGVRAVLTAADIPGERLYSLHKPPDQPVLVGVGEEVRYRGEQVAIVAADHPEQARLAAEAIEVDYQELPAVTDPVEALRQGLVHRELVIRCGDVHATAAIVVDGYYEVGQQDQAPLGPEAGLAIPTPQGGVDLFVATQALHVDLEQVEAALALPKGSVRIHLAGVGGAFGAREDLSIHIHACLLALRTGRPVKMWYGREESFVGHVHRHPARMWYSTGADAEGNLVFTRATIVLDGGAYASSSGAVTANAACFGAGPYRMPNALVWSGAARTNSVPNGAMRGFGAVQTCFAHESQMDALAARLGMDPVHLRLKNALRSGDPLITGPGRHRRRPDGGADPPLRRHSRATPLGPPPRTAGRRRQRRRGGRRGSPERLRGRLQEHRLLGGPRRLLDRPGPPRAGADGKPVASVKTAAAEVGQGVVTITEQIVRTELGVEQVRSLPADTTVGDAGSSSASRQTWMTGTAVQRASRRVVAEVLRRAGPPARSLDAGQVLDAEGVALAPIELFLDTPIEREFEFHHKPTSGLDPDGQGDAHVSFMFVAHRATVDVDPEAGLARVVQVATAQDVGKALNPLQVHGQIEGGIAQGVGMATMEEIKQREGVILNASFTDYIIPTALDMPLVSAVLVEEPEPDGPYGAKGVGEPPLISSPAAIAAALRAATGHRLGRLPVTPDELAGLSETEPEWEIDPGSPPSTAKRRS